MVDISDFIDPGDDEPEEEAADVAADFAALKDCLQALADAIASTNLAVIQSGQGDVPAATARVQASIGALKRFHDAFKVLKDEGYILDYRTAEAGPGKTELEVALKYYEGRPVIETLRRFSRSGRRQYRGKSELPKVLNGLGIAIISTSKGIMTDSQARQQGVGGEVLCFVA